MRGVSRTASFYKHFVLRKQHLIGASVTRALYGLWLLSFYLQSFAIRTFVWGNDGPISHDGFLDEVSATGAFSVLSYSSDPRWLTACTVMGVCAAILVAIGANTRSSLIVSLVLLWSFHARNGYILDGGDNIGRIVLIFLVFMDCSAISIDSQVTRLGRQAGAAAVFHNIALYAITVQLSVLYLASGLSKVTGELWQNGTALYYVLNSNNFSRPLFGNWLSRNYAFVTAASYSVMALQCSFVFLVWSKRFRVPLILSLMAMHVSIAYVMGLVRFSHVMIASLALLVPESAYRVLAQQVKRFSAPLLKSFGLEGVGGTC